MTDRGRSSRVVVLGATGFVGRAVVERLRASGAEVVGHGSATCDLLDPERTHQVVGSLPPDASVVLASAIRRTLEDTFESFVRNLRIVHNVAEALPARGLRSLVFLSSVDVYGRPPASLPLSEATLPRPTSHYGIAKSASEQILGLVPSGAAAVTVLRLPGVYGDAGDERSVVSLLSRRVAAGEPVRLTGDGSALRDYVHVDDVAALVERCVERAWSGTVNVVTGRSVSLREIVEAAGATLGRSPEIELDPGAPTGGDLVFEADVLRDTFPEIGFRAVLAGVRELAAAL